MDWNDRLDKYSQGLYENLREEMFYKKVTHFHMHVSSYASRAKDIISNVLDEMSRDLPIQEKLTNYYSKRDPLKRYFEFGPITTVFERIDGAFVEVLYPKKVREIVDFFIRQLVIREIRFKTCKSCGRFFPAIGHGNSEYCNRLFKDTDKTCKEIGSIEVYRAKVEENREYAEYNRAYKRNFAKIKTKKMTKEQFREWSTEARIRRDKVTSGRYKLEDYLAWLNMW